MHRLRIVDLDLAKKTAGWWGKKRKVTLGSRLVSHASTNRAQRCLTSLIGREAVFPTWYEPCMEHEVMFLNTNPCVECGVLTARVKIEKCKITFGIPQWQLRAALYRRIRLTYLLRARTYTRARSHNARGECAGPHVIMNLSVDFSATPEE